MNVSVSNTADRLARQSRQIVIFDLVGLRVEQVQHVELYPQAIFETVAGAGIENEGGQRADAVILDEGTWAEIARLQRAKPTRFIAEGHGTALNPSRRAGDAIARRIEIGKARAGISEVEIERQPRRRLVLVGPLDADAAAGPARLGGAGIADEQKFGVEIEYKDRDRTGQTFDRLGADTEFGAARADQQRYAVEWRYLVAGSDRNRCATEVIGMQAVAGIAKKLRLVPRTKHDAGLRACYRRLRI